MKSTFALTSSIPYFSIPVLNTFPKLRKARSAVALNRASDDEEYDEYDSEDYVSSDTDDDPLSLRTDFAKTTKRLTLYGLDADAKGDRSLETQTRYYGNSSSFRLISATRVLKMMHMNDMQGDNGQKIDPQTAKRRAIENGFLRREEFWKAPPVSSAS